uniref:Zinc finger PHD-type domain-containing protein n=1 Tax=Amphimedon queenslandica TaxID=400682 RepID=A0A1X7V998_AMPQE
MTSASNEVILRLSGEVVIKSSITPIGLHYRRYFSDLFQKNKMDRERTEITEEEKQKEIKNKKTVAKRAPTKKVTTELKQRSGTKVSSTKATRATQKSLITRQTKSRVRTPSTSPTTFTDDEGICEECGGSYKGDNKATRCRMGCDKCDRWFHCHCIGLRVVLIGHWSRNCC